MSAVWHVWHDGDFSRSPRFVPVDVKTAVWAAARGWCVVLADPDAARVCMDPAYLGEITRRIEIMASEPVRGLASAA